MPSIATIRLNPNDNVVVAVTALEPGTEIVAEGITTRDAIPFGHKVSTKPIPRGTPVRKYGQVIGVASEDIAPGQHVHVQNLAFSDLREEADAAPVFEAHERPRTFLGYKRANGKVGTRNYIGVLTSVNCSATVARHIAEAAEKSGLLKDYPNIDGIVPITHPSGCGMAVKGEGYDLLTRTLWGTGANPNFAAVLLVGLGCEMIQLARFKQEYGITDSEHFQSFTIQDTGGTKRAIAEGLARLKTMLPAANAITRTPQPASELVIGLQCGGSDGWSGITANPALGNASDRLVSLGGTVLLSETPEIYGAEHLLYARAQSPALVEKLRARITWWEEYTAIHKMEMNNNPSPGNKAGGLTTILEKSLGAVAKAGTSPLVDVIEYAEPVKKHGLVFMDSPGFDPCSATGQVASGATMIAFTTGRGSAYGCKPSPSIKLATNSEVYRKMPDDMDLDCGTIATGGATVEEKGAEILDYLLAVASGQKSKSEELGYGDMEFVPWHIGAVM
ncbi:UxaA family hydrolase [Rhizomicrobium electricum]|uniref:Altronate dehydratase family protein n=1 Tax=Rhizomicrobium electricum TaxID=480070 RepID=A0ABN1EA54_9PROT|nr:altronate dehydratase family protein [Rhizomicrobium electricum]NIJ48053.1 altronate hydrolase [Rhizomicrobium electricum]